MRRRGRSSTSRDQLHQVVLSRSSGLFSFDPPRGSFVLLSRGGSDAAMDNSRACATASFLCPYDQPLSLRVCLNKNQLNPWETRERSTRVTSTATDELDQRVIHHKILLVIPFILVLLFHKCLYKLIVAPVTLSSRVNQLLHRTIRCLRRNFFSSIRSCSPLHRHHCRLCIVITISPRLLCNG